MNNNLANLEEKNAQVLKSISELQQMETNLYDELNDGNTSPERKEQIIQKINELSQMRLNMYSSLKDMYNFQQNNASAVSSVINQQLSAIDAIENELNETKLKMNTLKDKDYNKLRLVQINTYYGKKYATYAEVMKIIALFCISLIILGMLNNRGFIPLYLYVILITIILVLGVIIVGRKVIDIINRDNMNWDEYNWYFEKNKAPSLALQPSKVKNPWSFPSITCIGSSCCYEDSKYGPEENKCLPLEVYNKKYEDKETFVNNVLSKYEKTALKPTNNKNVRAYNK